MLCTSPSPSRRGRRHVTRRYRDAAPRELPLTLVDVAFGFCPRQLPTNEPPVVSDLARARAISMRSPELSDLSIPLAKGIGISLYLPP
ncbi:hypothetical protein ACWGI8_02045 [Streptomyces sp. NPDC054841]